MSHFVGLVFGSNVETLLEPYDENMEVEQYVRYTKDEAIDEVKTRHADNYEYAIKLADKYKNPTTDWEKEQLERANKIIEKGLFISYEDAWEEAKNWGYKIDDEENLMSTYNPDSKWDWYCEGGRWGAWLLLKEKGEDGDWHESASMGWWAMTTNDKDEDVWRKEFLDYLESVEDDVEISVIDFHI